MSFKIQAVNPVKSLYKLIYRFQDVGAHFDCDMAAGLVSGTVSLFYSYN